MNIVTDIAAISKKCDPVSLEKGHEIGEILISHLKENKGTWIGLAANQLGINARVCAIALQGNNTGTYKYFINPTIVDTSTETFMFREGCLSIPNKQAVTRRYRSITVKADNISEGSAVVFSADAVGDHAYELQLECACIQHEIDHLDGITMFDRAINQPIVNRPSIGRNQKVELIKANETKIIKYKKVQPLLDDGWSINKIL